MTTEDRMIPRLITIPFSHYCEKARWALDHSGVAYVEDAYLPGFHMLPTRRAGGKTVPVLVTSDGTLSDSADIVAYADASATADRKLYPTDPAARREVEALEALCNRDVGVSSRLIAYHHTLSEPRRLLEVVRPGLSRMGSIVFPFVMPLVRPLIRKRYGTTEPRAQRALETLRKAFAEISERLRSRPGATRWLVGDRLTAADITFASLASPLVLPEGHPAMAAVLDGAPGPLRSIVLELRATRAGEHALRLYREERRAKIA